MSNADKPVFIHKGDDYWTGDFGLTKREYFAAMAMQGLIQRGFTEFGNYETAYASLATKYADALLAALENSDEQA